MIGKFIRYFKGYQLYAVLCPLLMVLEVAADVVIPKLMGDSINLGIMRQDADFVLRNGLLMTAMALFGLTTGVLASWLGAHAGMGFGANLRAALFTKIQQFSFADLDQLTVPSLVTRLGNDVERLARLAQMSLRITIRAPLMFVMAFLMALRVNRRLSLIFAVAIPLMIAIVWLIARRVVPRFRRMQSQLDKLNAKVQESLRSIRVVKAFVREEYETENFEKENTALRDDSLAAIYTMILLMPLMSLVVYFCTIAVLWFGGLGLLRGQMGAGDLYSFILYIAQVLTSFFMLTMVLFNFARGKASAERVLEVLEKEVSIKNPVDGLREMNDGSMEFLDVNFRYPGSPDDSLKGISFRVESGETIALIGSTGSSKTTLVQLIPRLFDVRSGSVRVGGRDVREYDLKFLRDKVALILQKNTLFSGSIRENLQWGDEGADDEQLLEALEIASADEIIRGRSEGLDAEVEQDGANFSGGQKQRLCIARAILKKPRIMIFDDSTSALDMKTEARLNEALHKRLPEMTKMIIAQRIQAISKADRIILMDNGEISAVGTHEELLAQSLIYQEIYESQQKGRMAG